MNDEKMGREPCVFPSCGFNPEHNASCDKIRQAFGPCCGPCDGPCYIVANHILAAGHGSGMGTPMEQICCRGKSLKI